jgi:hypothetical protein
MLVAMKSESLPSHSQTAVLKRFANRNGIDGSSRLFLQSLPNCLS